MAYSNSPKEKKLFYIFSMEESDYLQFNIGERQYVNGYRLKEKPKI